MKKAMLEQRIQAIVLTPWMHTTEGKGVTLKKSQ